MVKLKGVVRINNILYNINKHLEEAFNEVKKLNKNKYGSYIAFDQVDSEKIRVGKNYIKKAKLKFRTLAA